MKSGLEHELPVPVHLPCPATTSTAMMACASRRTRPAWSWTASTLPDRRPPAGSPSWHKRSCRMTTGGRSSSRSRTRQASACWLRSSRSASRQPSCPASPLSSRTGPALSGARHPQDCGPRKHDCRRAGADRGAVRSPLIGVGRSEGAEGTSADCCYTAALRALTAVCPSRSKDMRVQLLVRDNNVDQALRALKKKMQREGIFREMKERKAYEKPSERKAREKAEAVRRARKLIRKRMQREGLLPSKPRPTR